MKLFQCAALFMCSGRPGNCECAQIFKIKVFLQLLRAKVANNCCYCRQENLQITTEVAIGFLTNDTCQVKVMEAVDDI